jgi:Protein of unknown function (DUF3891)
MVIGWLQQDQEDDAEVGASAWARVEAAQRQKRPACLLVPQPAHAVLAGELAAGLTCFGELPSEITRAIQMHDTGWAASDAQQIQRLRSGGAQAGHAVSFISIPPREVEEAWTASINTVETFSKTGAMIVSRHFKLLAGNDPVHQRFVEAEKARQRRLEGSGKAEDPPKGDDLERWTAALGFCDLVSLFLLSGLSREVELPLAHPASPQAQTAAQVRMQVKGRNLRFTPGVVLAGSVLSIQALKHPVPAQGPRAETLTWEVE